MPRLLDADRIGHAVLRLPEVEAALHARWGEDVFFGSAVAGRAEVDRRRLLGGCLPLRRTVLASWRIWRSLTHPLDRRSDCRVSGAVAAARAVAAAVLDAPVLYKAGWDQYCDRILFVDAPLEVRAARAAQRGWSREQLQARQEMQPSICTINESERTW